MRLCYLAPTGVHARRWLRYFAEAGHDVHLVTSETAPCRDLSDIRLHVLKRFGPQGRAANYLLNALPLMRQFRRLVREIEPDIVHAHYIMDISLLGAASRFHPFIVTAWGSDVLIEPAKSRIARLIDGYTLKRADLVTCDSEHMVAPLAALGANPERIEIIKFAVDIGRFKPAPKNARLTREMGTAGSPTVISLRRLEPVYNIETLISSAPLVLEKIPEAKFVLLGKGSLEGRLKLLAESLGVAGSVRFAGQVPADDVPAYLTSADICVSTALSDAGPGGIIEAMACQLPVITTDFGDNRQWVEDGRNGYIIPPHDHRALADRIVRLIENLDTRRRFGRANRRIIAERNNWQTEMGKMEKLYQQLATGGKNEI